MGTFASVSLYDRGSSKPVSGKAVRVTSWPGGGPVETDPAVLTTDYYGATPEFSTVDPDVHTVSISAPAARPRTVGSIETEQAVADAGPFLAEADQRLTELESRSGTSGSGLEPTATPGLLTVTAYGGGTGGTGDGEVITDHGALTGLGDDDHPQYALADGSRGSYAPVAHAHDDRYYTETEADGRFVRTVNGTGPDAAGDVAVGGGRVPTFGAFGALKRALASGATTAIQVVGDSTGNETWEWARLWLADLATAHPEFTVRALTWDDAAQDFTRTTVQTGTAGEEYFSGDGTAVRLGAPSIHLSGVIDCRVKIRAADWTPANNQYITGQIGGLGFRSWEVGLNTAGRPTFTYSVDGSGTGVYTANADPVGLTDGTDQWLRWVFTPDSGAGKSTIAFYQSADGTTWTQIGTTLTDTVVRTLFNASSPDPLAGFNLGGELVGAYGRWVGRIYEVQIRDGLNGPLVAPALPSLWFRTQVSSGPVVGAPTLTLVNASHPGADIAYLGDTARAAKMTPDFGQSVALLSDSHNEAHKVGPYFTAIYEGWMDTLRTRLPNVPFVILTQNPQSSSASWAPEHGKRRVALLAYAATNKIGAVDTYQAFLDYAGPLSELLADMVHPNSTGQAMWRDAIAEQYAQA